MLVQENVLQPQDKSAMMWWSRFQGKPMKLNARLSTHRNAHSLEVVDMETNQFYVENIYDLINALSLPYTYIDKSKV